MFVIDSGLFKFDFTDHHAVLGVPVDADIKDIRKRYLKVARRLHPDSCAAAGEGEKEVASQLLSRLVNPAYEQFSQERNRAEYMVVLAQIGKRLVQESASIELRSEIAKQLAQTPNVDLAYKGLIQKLAEKQYDSFNQVFQYIAQMSELNLVYLMRKGGKAFQSPAQPMATPANAETPKRTTTATPPPTPTAPQPPHQESVLDQYLRRAQTLITKNNFAQARVELQEALKLEPNNGRCHSLLGIVYVRQNQLTMAKVHINKALQLNPEDSTALKAKQFLEQMLQKTGHGTPASPKATQSKPSQGKPPDKPEGGGLLGGLFGGKKK